MLANFMPNGIAILPEHSEGPIPQNNILRSIGYNFRAKKLSQSSIRVSRNSTLPMSNCYVPATPLP